MNMLLIENEPIIRLGYFLGMFLAPALAELVAPRRRLTTSKASRRLANIGIVVICCCETSVSCRSGGHGDGCSSEALGIF